MYLPFRLLCALPACDKPSWVLPVLHSRTTSTVAPGSHPVSPTTRPTALPPRHSGSRRKILCIDYCGDQLNSNLPPVLLPHLSRLKLEYFEDESVLPLSHTARTRLSSDFHTHMTSKGETVLGRVAARAFKGAHGSQRKRRRWQRPWRPLRDLAPCSMTSTLDIAAEFVRVLSADSFVGGPSGGAMTSVS